MDHYDSCTREDMYFDVFIITVYASLILGAALALCFGLLLIAGGTVPVAHFGMSHWWDVLAPLVAIAGLFWPAGIVWFIEKRVSKDTLTVFLFVSVSFLAVAIFLTVKLGLMGTCATVGGAYVLSGVWKLVESLAHHLFSKRHFLRRNF